MDGVAGGLESATDDLELGRLIVDEQDRSSVVQTERFVALSGRWVGQNGRPLLEVPTESAKRSRSGSGSIFPPDVDL